MRAEAWKDTLREGLQTEDAGNIRRVPKTDLHCHGMLSAPLDAYAAIAGRPLPPPPKRFGGWRPFIDYITAHLLPLLPEPNTARTLMRAAFERHAADGVVYAETSFDLLSPDFLGLRIEEYTTMLAEEVERVADRVTIAPEIGIARGLPIDEIERRLKVWLASGVCRSIDLYDDENLGVLRDFVPLYRLAGEHGLKLKAHAGEMCGAAAVRDSVELLHLHAVQHGIRAAEDPAVVDFLVERGTVLHICPTSNCALGLCAALDQHPARRLFESGVTLTVNSDDFTLFGASVSDEILNLRRMGFSVAEIERIVENGLAEIPR